MPVWHERTREMREAGELVVVGITQEQHPQRCRLFAQWKELDFPILWDPFNLTGSTVVPNVIGVDEHGVVRSVRPDPATFEEEFLVAEFPAPSAAPERDADTASCFPWPDMTICAYTAEHVAPSPVASLMREVNDEAVDVLERFALDHPDVPELAFRAGVARRMRYDSPRARPDDFQAAVDHWARALALNPDQYIWRRRIQQYGPRLDKPYPFYDWVDEARREVAARGEVPVELRVALTPAELARPARAFGNERETSGEPDADGRIRRDEEGLIAIDSAFAFDTSSGRAVASVHLAFRPSVTRDAHWTHEAGPPLRVWLAPPEGWRVDRRLLEVPHRKDAAVSKEPANLSFEVELPDGVAAGDVPGYALYYVCSGADGTCAYLRQDFAVPVVRPE